MGVWYYCDFRYTRLASEDKYLTKTRNLLLLKTITSYYLTDIGNNIDKHKRALFYPTEEQKGEKNIESFIKNRSEWKSKSIEFDNPYENLDE